MTANNTPEPAPRVLPDTGAQEDRGDEPPTTHAPSPHRGRVALAAGVGLRLAAGAYAAGNAGGHNDTTTPAGVAAAEQSETVRDVEGEPAPAGLVETIEDMSLPDGAVTVTDATMAEYAEVYYVVAAVADTPDGEQILTYLHEPWESGVIDGAGYTTPINEAAQEWAPLAGAADDPDAADLADRLIVGE